MGIFKGPKAPKAPPVKELTPPPVAEDAQAAAEEELRKLNRRKGFAASLLTEGGAEGLGGATGGAGTKALLGA